MITVLGVGHVKVHQHRPVAGKVKTVGVKREGRKWFVVLTAERAQTEPLPATGSVIGIDMGTANFLTDSNGEHVPNPRHARCEHDVIAHEALKIRNMRKAPPPNPTPNSRSASCPTGPPPRRTGPHRKSSTASRAATRHTPTTWEHSTFYGPGWSVATPTRHSEKPPPSRGGGVTCGRGERRSRSRRQSGAVARRSASSSAWPVSTPERIERATASSSAT